MPHLRNKTIDDAVAALLVLQTCNNDKSIDYNRDAKKNPKFNTILEVKELPARLVYTTAVLLDY